MNISFIYPNALWLLTLLPLIIGLALLGRRRPTRARFWGGLVLRALLLSLLVLALAGIQIRRRADTLTAVFLLDASDSLPAEERALGETLIRQAIGAMPVKQVWLVAAGGFALFRIFDITKAWPIRKLETLPKGWGILADDLLAGVYAWVVLQLCIRFFIRG